METMICTCCGAKLVPTTLTPFLTCEYCDNSVTNPHYDASAAAEAEKPDAAAICLKLLRELGAAQNLASLDRDCFGDPIDGIDAARTGLSIPDDQQVYLLYAHTVLFVAFSDGLALTDGGVYYACDAGKGSLSWEAFATGAIACVDRNDDQDGVLRIGSGIDLAIKSDKDSRLARFLVDFHNQAYHQYTGETAPAAWTVTEPAVAAAQEEDSSLLGSVLPGIGALLGSAIVGQRTTARQPVVRQAPAPRRAQPGTTKRAPTLHATSRPTVRQDRRDRVEPPRPLHTQPHQRPGAPARPGSSARPGSQANNLKRLFNEQRPGGNGRPGGAGRPGGNRPGSFERMNNERRPGGRGRR